MLSEANIADAYTVLDIWHRERERDDDYLPSKEALDLFFDLELSGYLVYADEVPVAYTIGEPLQNGKAYVVHIEKGINAYRGVYQFINMAYCAFLPTQYRLINREQDLGNPGLRQSKMTYMPHDFVKKYRIYPVGTKFPLSVAAEMESRGEATWDTELKARHSDPNASEVLS